MRLGGEDIDAILVSHFVRQFKLTTGVDLVGYEEGKRKSKAYKAGHVTVMASINGHATGTVSINGHDGTVFVFASPAFPPKLLDRAPLHS